ncbi:MAG TPA: hypothetical protein VFT98_10020 [Myxococcota bacterium]|nr:hypothetical protein [Myxococcota bacterium]
MRRSGLWISIACALCAVASAAETPAVGAAPPASATPPPAPPQAAAWDDSHMQSRYQPTPPTNRPRISGESGYAALTSGSSETRTAVSESVEFATQRQWTQGALSTVVTPVIPPSSGGKDGNNTPHISRGSALRAGAVSSGRN